LNDRFFNFHLESSSKAEIGMFAMLGSRSGCANGANLCRAHTNIGESHARNLDSGARISTGAGILVVSS
jgi:hypothetical protein